MEEALRALLLGTQGLTAHVGPSGVDWAMMPQGAPYPRVVLHLVSDPAQMTMAGPDTWHRSRVQVDCWASTYKAARDIAAVIAGDDGILNGARLDENGVRFRSFVGDRSSDTDKTTNDVVIHRTRVDLNLWWNAS